MQGRIWIATLAVAMAVAAPAHADEADNFTCRARLQGDAGPELDAWVNARLAEAVARANGQPDCDRTCLSRLVQRHVGGSALHPLSWVPHSRLAIWTRGQRAIDRCTLRFSESIYGARPYNQPWLIPFTRRIIFLDDSILLSGRVVGVDKINHFVREGLAHWRAVSAGESVSEVLIRERGRQGRPLAMTEYGLKGLSLTGVLAYADLAASYAGLGFWRRALSYDTPQSYVGYDPRTRRFVVRRPFTFAEFVTDAWDEGVNRSVLHPVLARQVAAALAKRNIADAHGDCGRLATLPDATLYVNPACLEANDTRLWRGTLFD